MLEKIPYTEARDLLVRYAQTVGEETVPLWQAAGRVLSQSALAKQAVPAFDRSPYDGYALRSEDTVNATAQTPVTLHIVEELPAGSVPTCAVGTGEAAKILTGAPIPEGADTVIPFERTEFTDQQVTVFAPLKAGMNIVRLGEDVPEGALLAEKGTLIDPGVVGALAAQGYAQVCVYRKPVIGVLSTGSELIEQTEALTAGKIYDTNRYFLGAAIGEMGCEVRYLGSAGDDTGRIAALFAAGLEECDAIISTGGVSVGDKDLTPAAMEQLGAEILCRGIAMKPGMAAALAVCQGKLLLGLSGNPASSATTFYAVIAPVLRKLCGRKDVLPRQVAVKLSHPFTKKSPHTRLLRGNLELRDGQAQLELRAQQGNVNISRWGGCDVMAEVPAGTGPLEAGTVLQGFLLER